MSTKRQKPNSNGRPKSPTSVGSNGRATKKPGGVTGKGFMPGKSGNPSGRSPRVADFGKEVRELLQAVYVEANRSVTRELCQGLRARHGESDSVQRLHPFPAAWIQEMPTTRNPGAEIQILAVPMWWRANPDKFGLSSRMVCKPFPASR